MFGFSRNHLVQISKFPNCEPETVRDSIDYFVFDLEHNQKQKEIKGNPLSYFMGIMRNAGVYAAPDNYESARDRALRVYLERQQQMAKRRAELEKQLLEMEREKWLEGLTDAEKEEMIPENLKQVGKQFRVEGPRISAIHEFFEENVWPELKKKHEAICQAD